MGMLPTNVTMPSITALSVSVVMIKPEPDLAVCGEASDAAGALEAIATLKPDMAIMELMLKDSSGIKLIQEIGQRYKELPVLVLSGHDESFYAERAIRAGARGYI